jgi:hypothetical protein
MPCLRVAPGRTVVAGRASRHSQNQMLRRSVAAACAPHPATPARQCGTRTQLKSVERGAARALHTVSCNNTIISASCIIIGIMPQYPWACADAMPLPHCSGNEDYRYTLTRDLSPQRKLQTVKVRACGRRAPPRNELKALPERTCTARHQPGAAPGDGALLGHTRTHVRAHPTRAACDACCSCAPHCSGAPRARTTSTGRAT